MSSGDQRENYGKPWTREELILAFDLYCRIPFKKTKANTPEVQDLAVILNRSPAAIARKLGNFGAFDPELRRLKISGLTHVSRLDRTIWHEFHSNWNDLVFEAHRLRESFAERIAVKSLPPKLPEGPTERTRLSRERIHQAFFRDSVLSNYECRCCITGLTVTECLIASHIVPWSHDERYRVDPTNGLCLSATFDRLFDAGIITIAEDMTVQVSKRLRSCVDEVVVRLICAYHNRHILKPQRFMPSPKHLEWHRSNVFVESS